MTREERIKSALLPILEKMREHGATDEMCKMYDNGFHVGAMWADTHPQWISVDVELPPKQPNREQSKNVLVRTNSGRTKIEYYDYGNDVIKEWWEYNITHWMQIPPPPTVAKNATVNEKGGKDE